MDMDEHKDDSEDNHHSRSSLQRSSSATESKINLMPSNTTSNNNNNTGMKDYTYLDINSDHNNGSNGMKEAGQHPLSSSFNTASSSSNVNNNNDYKKPTAGWTLFAQLAKMTPEEVELIRLTKANTAANKQICAVPDSLPPFAAVQSNSKSDSNN
ncbi:hypothetical protein BGZ47_004115, partial [Haplosporangium gracile]